MALITTDPSVEPYLSKRRLVFDTSSAFKMLELGFPATIKKLLDRDFSIGFISPTIIEMGLGPEDKMNFDQYKTSAGMYTRALARSTSSRYFAIRDALGFKQNEEFVYNPSPHEWFFAKNALIRLITDLGLGSSNYQALQMDAIIFTSAWNISAILITEDTSDFMKFNLTHELQKRNRGSGKNRFLPIFTFDELLESETRDISFPENIPQDIMHMVKR